MSKDANIEHDKIFELSVFSILPPNAKSKPLKLDQLYIFLDQTQCGRWWFQSI